MNNKIYELSEDEFISLIRNSNNKAEVLFKLGYSVKGNSWGYTLLRKRMEELHLNGTEFKGRSGFKDKVNESLKLENVDKILCENSPHTRAVIRRFVLKNNLIPYKCSCCGNEGMWLDKPLSLQLDHINGNCSDHRLENLRWLCPNCHVQTSTHGSKNEASKYINQEYVIRYDLDHNEIARYGSINEMCQAVINAGETRTKIIKTCRNTFNRNRDKVWLGSYWKVITPENYKEL